MSEKKHRDKPSEQTKEASEDFWDLGDNDLELSEPSEQSSNSQTEAKETDQSPPSGETPKSKPTDKSEDQPGDKAEDQPGELDQDHSSDHANSEPTKSEIKKDKKEADEPSSLKESIPTSPVEKISLSILIITLIAALIWGLSTFLSEAPQGKVITFIEDYPAKGEHATISSVKTWWKKPIRSGENADTGIVLEAALVPCAEITLSESSSTTLRITFRNGAKELIGDTINLDTQNGKFTRNDSQTITVYATSGFYSSSNINSYANGDIDPWSLIITEGLTGNEDNPLVRARISAHSSPQ